MTKSLRFEQGLPRTIFLPQLMPVVLLLVSIISFGLFIPVLGLYWDDWETLFVIATYPLSEFWAYFSANRPLAAWSFIFFGYILGDTPVFWHIFALLMRWLTMLSLGWLLMLLWPKRRQQNFWIVLIFSIYPVFMQQAIPLAFHQHWIAYAAFLTSLGLMVLSVRPTRWRWAYILLAMMLVGLHLITFEYFIGVEFLRPLVLWLVIDPTLSIAERIKKILRYWIPYLLLLGGFLAWRILFALDSASDPNRPTLLFDLFKHPITALPALMQIVLKDLIFLFVSCWYKVLEPGLVNFDSLIFVAFWGVALICGALLAFYLYKLNFSVQTDQPGDNWVKQALIFGGVSVLLGSAPIWATGRLGSGGGLNADRFVMVSMFGASIVLVAFLEWLTPARVKKIIVISVLVALAINLHLRVNNDYRSAWSTQKRVFWQLYWRAPAVLPQTTFLSDGQFTPYLIPTFTLNVLYQQPIDGSRAVAYWYYMLNREFAEKSEEWLQGKTFQENYRELTYKADSRDSLVLYYDQRFAKCLWVLSQEDQETPYIPDLARRAIPLSNLTRIQPVPTSDQYPPARSFGAEPAQDWCFYYEKGALAQQYQQWDEVVRLGKEARQKGYYPDNSQSKSPHEWMPFIEGYARTDDVAEAEKLTIASYESDPQYQKPLCNLWTKIVSSTEVNPSLAAGYQNIKNRLNCK